MEEKQLIISLKKGEEQGFEIFVERYGDRLYRSLYYTLKDEAAARDLVQDTFVKVVKHIKSFNGNSKLYTWVYRIAINQMKDGFKKKQEDVMDLEELNIGVSHVESEAVNNFHRDQVANCMKAVPLIYRQVLVLFYYEELKIREIAEILEEKEGTVKSKLHRGKVALKETLIEREVFHEKETI